MKKFILMFVMLLSVAMSYGQVAYEKAKVLDNVYVGANVGATTPLSFNHMFPLNTTFGIKVGKDFTPVFGLNIEGTTWFGSNASVDHHYFNRFDREDVHNVFRSVNVGLNGTINWTNLFFESNKTFVVYSETGLGWMHTFNANMEDANDMTAKTGLAFGWNAGKAFQLYVEPTVWWNLTRDNWRVNHDIKFNKNRAQLGIHAGIVYKFKTSNGTHNFVTWNVGQMNDDINNLRAENARLAEAASRVPNEVVRTEIQKEFMETQYFVFFAQNSYDLDDDAINTLNAVPTNSVVDVKASASPEGTPEYNQKLSEKRAEVVAKYLESRGVKVNSTEGMGAYGNTSNRVAAIIVSE